MQAETPHSGAIDHDAAEPVEFYTPLSRRSAWCGQRCSVNATCLPVTHHVVAAPMQVRRWAYHPTIAPASPYQLALLSALATCTHHKAFHPMAKPS